MKEERNTRRSSWRLTTRVTAREIESASPGEEVKVLVLAVRRAPIQNQLSRLGVLSNDRSIFHVAVDTLKGKQTHRPGAGAFSTQKVTTKRQPR